MKNFSPNCYTTIDDLPIYNWFKYQETKDASFILIQKRKLSKKETSATEQILSEIYDEYIAKFGFSDNFLAILKKEKELALLQCELINTDNNTLYTFIGIAETELAEMKNKNFGEHNFYETKSAVDKILGIQLNIKKTSVAEFYSHIKAIEKQNNKAA